MIKIIFNFTPLPVISCEKSTSSKIPNTFGRNVGPISPTYQQNFYWGFFGENSYLDEFSLKNFSSKKFSTSRGLKYFFKSGI